MIRSNAQLLQWLRNHCQRDRVILNALNHPQSIEVCYDHDGWDVTVVSQRGKTYQLRVTGHPVTGEPVGWYRETPVS